MKLLVKSFLVGQKRTYSDDGRRKYLGSTGGHWDRGVHLDKDEGEMNHRPDYSTNSEVKTPNALPIQQGAF